MRLSSIAHISPVTGHLFYRGQGYCLNIPIRPFYYRIFNTQNIKPFRWIGAMYKNVAIFKEVTPHG